MYMPYTVCIYHTKISVYTIRICIIRYIQRGSVVYTVWAQPYVLMVDTATTKISAGTRNEFEAFTATLAGNSDTDNSI